MRHSRKAYFFYYLRTARDSGYDTDNRQYRVYHLRNINSNSLRHTVYDTSDKTADGVADSTEKLRALAHYPCKTGYLSQTAESREKRYKSRDSRSRHADHRQRRLKVHALQCGHHRFEGRNNKSYIRDSAHHTGNIVRHSFKKRGYKTPDK